MMENNELMKLANRYSQIKSDMLHGGYSGDLLEETITDVITNEILEELGNLENPDKVKKALINMFAIGAVMSK